MSGGNAVSAALRQPAPEPVADHLFELPTLRPVRLPRSLRAWPPLALLPRRFSQRARPLRRGGALRHRKAGAAQRNCANGAERLTERRGC